MPTWLLLFVLLGPGGPGSAAQAAAPPEQQQPPPYAETVIVTASRSEQKLLDAPVSTTVVPEAQIETSAATTIGEVLQGVAGLNVVRANAREINVGSRQAAAALGSGQLVLLDGRVVNNGAGGMYWDQLPVDLDEIQQIEILHGPSSVVWGSNALSAVINLRTKSPKELQGWRVAGILGAEGMRAASFRWADAGEKFSYKISGSVAHHDGWPRSQTLPDGSPATPPLLYTNPDTTLPKADVRVDYERDADHVWSFRGGFGGSSGMLFTNDLPFEFQPVTYMGFADVSYRSPSIDGRVYWTRSAGHMRSLVDGSSSPFRADFPTGDIVMRKPVGGKQLLVGGGSVRLDFFDLEPIPDEHSRHEFGAFVEDQWFPTASLQINAGVRLDYVQTSGPAVSPRVSVLVKPARDHALRFSVSQGYRAPNPIENFLRLSTGYSIDLAPGLSVPIPFTIVGNPDLDEVRSLGVEGGYTGVIARRHTVQATVYRIGATDTIQLGTTEYYSPSQPPPTWPFPPATVPPNALPMTASYRNTGTVTDAGLELSVNSAWTPHVWSAVSYTFQRTPTVRDVTPGFAVSVNTPAPHQGSALIGWDAGQWRGSAGILYSDKAYWTDVVATDPRLRGWTRPYTLLNAAVIYAIPHQPLEVAVKSTNLLNHGVEQRIYGDIIGRDVCVEVRVDVSKRRP